MVKRFSSALSLINLTIKTRNESCDIPVNKLTLNVLRILRDRGYIWGFHYTSPGRRSLRYILV